MHRGDFTSTCRFSIVDLTGTQNVVGTLVEPTLSDGGSSGGGLYQIPVDTTVFPTGDGCVAAGCDPHTHMATVAATRSSRAYGYVLCVGVAAGSSCVFVCGLGGVQVPVSSVGHGRGSGT